MELLKLYSKEKTIFFCFCLIKLLFIKVRCLRNVNVSLEANLEDKDGKQNCLIPFVGSNLGVEIYALKWRIEARLYTFY